MKILPETGQQIIVRINNNLETYTINNWNEVAIVTKDSISYGYFLEIRDKSQKARHYISVPESAVTVKDSSHTVYSLIPISRDDRFLFYARKGFQIEFNGILYQICQSPLAIQRKLKRYE